MPNSAACARWSLSESVIIRVRPTGNTALARMPCGAPSLARPLVSPMMPPFAAP